ncbi:hypothetical protein VNO80_29411 [Phaseolus coccineus]|uniref:Uncharacterized protein n=1 Tax=Phaseolus coccineus TaxID=3886 RepID=A0AAN9LBE4_PHACN
MEKRKMGLRIPFTTEIIDDFRALFARRALSLISFLNLTSTNPLPATVTAIVSDDVVVDRLQQPFCSDAETVSYDEYPFFRDNFSKVNIDCEV